MTTRSEAPLIHRIRCGHRVLISFVVDLAVSKDLGGGRLLPHDSPTNDEVVYHASGRTSVQEDTSDTASIM